MARVDVRKDESIDKALKIFKHKVRRDGIMEEIRKREFYEKPSEQRRKRAAKARRKEFKRSFKEE